MGNYRSLQLTPKELNVIVNNINKNKDTINIVDKIQAILHITEELKLK